MDKREIIKKRLQNKIKSRNKAHIIKNDDGTYGINLENDEELLKYLYYQIINDNNIDIRIK